MNLLKKQGFYNSITLYLGTSIGFFNLIILFQRFLTTEQIGFFNLQNAIVLLYTQIASLGISSVITRYFPFFRTSDGKHKGFPSFVILVSLGGFILVTSLFLLFKDSILAHYSKDKGASLLKQYYYYIVPLSFFTLAYLIQETFSRAIFKNILPAFLREVMLKVFTSTGVILIFLNVFDYKEFITLYLIANAIIVIAITIYNKYINVYRISGLSTVVKNEGSALVKFGLFSMLSGSAVAFIQNLDVVMLGFLSDERMIGIYTTFFSIGVVISLPAKALNTTSYQIIAEAWKTEDLEKIGRIYHKTSIVQFLIGCLLLIGLIINKSFILSLLKPEMSNYFGVFSLIGVGYLVDITGGLNGAIISFSKYYRVTMAFLIGAALACAIFNLSLIPAIGLYGAALAYLLTMVVLNFSYWLYLKVKFGLQPFGIPHILILVISALCLVVGLFLPKVGNVFFDMMWRSMVVSIIFLVLVYVFKISDDINSTIKQLLNKFIK